MMNRKRNQTVDLFMILHSSFVISPGHLALASSYSSVATNNWLNWLKHLDNTWDASYNLDVVRTGGSRVLNASGNNSVVECDLAKVEVVGSNPISRSIPQ